MFGQKDPIWNAISIPLLTISVLSTMLLIFSPMIVIGAGGFTPMPMAAAVSLFVCSTLPTLMNIAVVGRNRQDIRSPSRTKQT
jgi:hypothetical protein